MHRTHGFKLILAAFVLALMPALAHADARLTAFGGTSRFDGDSKGTFGVSFGFGSLIGLEFDAARIQLGSFKDIPVIDLSAHATTYSGNFVVRFPAGPIQPYGTVGLGVVRVTGEVNAPIVGDLVSASAQDWGWNIGGGVFVFPSEHIGIRGDIRHFRTGDMDWDDIAGIGGINDLPLPQLDFWRVTGGVVFKF